MPVNALARAVRVPEGVLFREVDGEAVLLELESGRYFGLDRVGTRMWTLLGVHHRLEPVYESLVEEYEVAADTLRRDLVEFVDRLVANRLLEIDET